tara:strand:- start:243 stop:458 length:216 start_codon:yes stop_codon:yes gene_type:complete
MKESFTIQATANACFLVQGFPDIFDASNPVELVELPAEGAEFTKSAKETDDELEGVAFEFPIIFPLNVMVI